MTDVLDRIGDQLQLGERRLYLATSAAPPPAPTPSRERRLRSLTRRHFVVLLALVAAPATAGGIAIADSLGGTVLTDQQYYYQGQRAVAETAMTPDQTAQLGILRRPLTRSDAVSPSIAAVADANFPVGQYGASLALARLAQQSAGVAAWVIPANRGLVCLDIGSLDAHGPYQPGGPACQSVAAMTRGAIYETLASDANHGAPAPGNPRPTLLAGLVPDGVDAVTVNLLNGVAESIPVHNNVYMTTLPATGYLDAYANLGKSPPPPSAPTTVSITFRGPTGTVTEPLGPQGVIFHRGS